ncbi:hypothetical protein KQI22_13020 [Kineothrix sp. MSJ-39]|uniref:hypothetical protein n=1 Tax=Kineothrix sp. MSJ-39 TaxID=2841533 RepID=UPI001C118C8C|nr:hypothetical protein [Kineothrix sp. MSJ-39]MBU5430971.1 hypothetical protein [Kineothrix sp. MSJ-39]
MSSKKNEIPEGFTLGMALMDAMPVLLFSISVIMIAAKFHSVIFLVGAVCSALAGCGKVSWKLLLALKKKNIFWLNAQFRYLMTTGMVMILLSVVLSRSKIHLAVLRQQILHAPSIWCFGAAVFGMAALIYMGIKLDRTDAKGNWIEQSVNLFVQLMILIGIIVL